MGHWVVVPAIAVEGAGGPGPHRGGDEMTARGRRVVHDDAGVKTGPPALHDAAMTPRPLDRSTPRSVTVVVSAYTERRWSLLVRAIASLHSQRRTPEQIVLVVDHNAGLLERASSAFGAGVEVRPNLEQQGLSGARNTGIGWASSDVVAFLDDDAEAAPGWVEELLAHYGSGVAGTGGVAVPEWPGRGRPLWFPREFDWVVGCSYVGLPDSVTPQRNLIGSTMSFRRAVFDAVGRFDTDMGRIGSVPLGCEETEFGIRLRRVLAGSQLLHVPTALVHHHVDPDRTRVRYFLRRCYAEGISKAAVTRLAGGEQALSSERAYVRSTLPRGFVEGLRSGARGDGWGLARSAMLVAGLLTTLAGYTVGRAHDGVRSVGGSAPGGSTAA